MMKFAKKKLKKNKIYFSKLDELNIPTIQNNRTCIVAIGVIEYLKIQIFSFIYLKNQNINIFFSVPLFSLSVILENSFKNIYLVILVELILIYILKNQSIIF